MISYEHAKSISPKVSVLLPNLNTRRFLVERLDSIINQTLTDWELIIIDSYSDDGSWEVIQEYAAHDRRFRISQAPRDGIYPNLNRCIMQARGEYVYIAMSDDTMSPECLATMTVAMDVHPECDLCHTCLQVIDAEGRIIPDFWEQLPVVQFFGALMQYPHIRWAPYDGVVHCGVYTVYTSLTQLLIRRTVFDRIGYFRTEWGSEGDFEWGVRVGLGCNVLHLPVKLATWRRHSDQATQQYNSKAADRKSKFCQMIRAAFSNIRKASPSLCHQLKLSRLCLRYRQEQFQEAIWEQSTHWARYRFLLRFLLIQPDMVGQFVFQRLCRRPFTFPDRITFLHLELTSAGLTDHITVLPPMNRDML